MNAAPNSPVEGILLIDKPAGCTSHDVVARVRRHFQIKKVGHAGTLDPLATGLLILLVGKATKVSQYLISLSKEYEGSFKLGQATDSHDSDGEVVEEKSLSEGLDEAAVREEMQTFVGDQYQTPPMFSAKKHKGKPLYKMAREGKVVEREPRFVHVSAFNLTASDIPCGDFHVACSKGTYVRTLIHDLGQNLDCGAHMTALRRTSIDRFHIDQAITLEELEEGGLTKLRRQLIPIYQAVPSHAL